MNPNMTVVNAQIDATRLNIKQAERAGAPIDVTFALTSLTTAVEALAKEVEAIGSSLER